MQSDDSDDAKRIERIQRLSNQLSEAIASSARQRKLARRLAEEVTALAETLDSPKHTSKPGRSTRAVGGSS